MRNISNATQPRPYCRKVVVSLLFLVSARYVRALMNKPGFNDLKPSYGQDSRATATARRRGRRVLPHRTAKFAGVLLVYIRQDAGTRFENPDRFFRGGSILPTCSPYPIAGIFTKHGRGRVPGWDGSRIIVLCFRDHGSRKHSTTMLAQLGQF